MVRFEQGVKARYGSALKSRYMQASFGDRQLADRHERMNSEIKRARPSQCQFTNSSITANHLVTIDENPRPMTANSHSKNNAQVQQGAYSVKKQSSIK